MNHYYEYEETTFFENENLYSDKITRSDYGFRCNREYSLRDADYFWSEEHSDCYFIHATRLG